MHIVLTAFAGFFLIGSIIAWWRAVHFSDRAADTAEEVQEACIALRTEAVRITATERELEALRRELRKLSGKFYASQREQPDDDPPPVSERDTAPPVVAPFCANYGQAQIEGPNSKAARCECDYCAEMRARRDLSRAQLVPKTVQGQAALAKLNASKP